MNTRNKYYLKKATLIYFLCLLCCSAIFARWVMPWFSFVSGIAGVIVFFVLSVTWEKAWKDKDDKAFERRLFFSAVLLRLLWITLYYEFTTIYWDTPWEQPIGTSIDSYAYYYEAEWAKEMLENGLFKLYINWRTAEGRSVTDLGYPLVILLCNIVSDSSIFFTRIPNAIFDAWTAVLVYRIAKRNFGGKTAQLASIYTVLMPMLMFYAGVTMKESIMLMLTMWALNIGDIINKEGRLNVINIVSFVLIVFLLYLFRDVVSWVLLISLVSSYAISSPRIKQASQRTIFLVIMVSMVLLIAGGDIMQRYETLEAQLEKTEDNFVNRGRTNTLVVGLSKAALAPFMFTIPFPTMVEIPGQYVQAIQNGGYYLKNILSFFCMFGVFDLFVRSKKWRNSSLLLEFLFGYLIVLALSSFAHSGRFHHPIICIELILAAYGMNAIKSIRQARLMNVFMYLEIIIVIGWNWFKLAGRGML